MSASQAGSSGSDVTVFDTLNAHYGDTHHRGIGSYDAKLWSDFEVTTKQAPYAVIYYHDLQLLCIVSKCNMHHLNAVR